MYGRDITLKNDPEVFNIGIYIYVHKGAYDTVEISLGER
jgi:hypothetical protein